MFDQSSLPNIHPKQNSCLTSLQVFYRIGPISKQRGRHQWGHETGESTKTPRCTLRNPKDWLTLGEKIDRERHGASTSRSQTQSVKRSLQDLQLKGFLHHGSIISGVVWRHLIRGQYKKNLQFRKQIEKTTGLIKTLLWSVSSLFQSESIERRKTEALAVLPGVYLASKT